MSRSRSSVDDAEDQLRELVVSRQRSKSFGVRVDDHLHAARLFASAVDLISAKVTFGVDVEVEDAVCERSHQDLVVWCEVVVGAKVDAFNAFNGEAVSSAMGEVGREQVEGCRAGIVVAEADHHNWA